MTTDDGAGWRKVAQALLSGITHDLNGRLTALAGLAHVARASAGMEPELLGILDDQVKRLDESIRLLRSMPLAGAAQPELIRLHDLVLQLARLYGARSGPEPPVLDVAGDTSVVVRLDGDNLAEAVLLMMAALEPCTSTRAGALRVRYGFADHEAYVSVEAVSPTAATARAGGGRIDRTAALEEAAALAQRLPGRMLRPGDPAGARRAEIRLPAITV